MILYFLSKPRVVSKESDRGESGTSVKERGLKLRRSVVSVLLGALVLVGAVVAPPASAGSEATFVAGSGRASAQILRVGPSQGQLSLTPTAGASLTTYLGTVGIAEARAIDWAALEDTVHGLEDDTIGSRIITEELYPHVKLSSTAEGADAGRREEHPPFVQDVRATKAPRAEATTSLLPVSVPGVLSVAGGRSHSFAGLARVETDGGERFVREAGGVVVIPRVELGGGTVVFEGLRWEAVQRTDSNDDATPQTSGSFVMGGVTIAGERIDGPITVTELEALVGPINEALAPSGLRIEAPATRDDGGAVTVDPLAIRISESQLGRSTLGPVLEGAQPVREPVFGAIIDNCDDCKGLILLGDVTLGVLSGASTLRVDLGGVFGYTEGATFDSPFQFDFDSDFEPGPGSTASPAGGGSAPSVLPTRDAATTAGGPAPLTPATSPPPAGERPQPTQAGDLPAAGLAAPSTTIASRSTPSVLWAAALFGFAAVLAMGWSDFRRIRAWRRGVLT
ncbi:MAG TPA: hypothetical protein VM618_00940 [Acidimicrobiia bacterium]|nr:hypothetical protein [Acidimicrobiia bacterium]